ncbi:NB-ARC domain-containing protein [Streptomyces decoyicus]|uniref:NB-ARC domain-containing protein n=1 Tax=Streptomyces decoyicus TaxID=249567 RepID=UPI00345C9F31
MSETGNRSRRERERAKRLESSAERPPETLGARGVAAGDNVALATTGDHNNVDVDGDIVGGDQLKFTENKYYLPTEEAPIPWPLRLGAIPLTATAFQPRPQLRAAIDASATRTHVLSGGGGVGKSQLAAAYATEAVADEVDLVLWVPATESAQVISLYAHAARLVRAPGVTGDSPEADAEAFLSWTATTTRRWLIVLDNVGDPAALTPWWPTGASGRVLATSRTQDARLTGGGRVRVTVDLYASDECIAFLETRLAGEACTR